MAQCTRRLIVTLLTLGRAPLIVAGTVLALCLVQWHYWLLWWGMLLLMGASAITDLFDGWLARKWKVTSKFGAMADPLMDKVFYILTLPTAVFMATKSGDLSHAYILLGLDVLSMLRDQWVTFLRSVGALYGADVRANWSGKFRTAIAFPIIMAVYAYLGAGLVGIVCPDWVRYPLFALELLLIAVTFWTLANYTLRYWPYLRKSLHD
ncbi:MAG: CDP-alcohol phosphatidyltransferase family protein [Kiritimatiellaeota bacterium]|nr:CDP-alcohol phosphatidyltransferase family protein [Kiritimatiellota bacterium]